MQFINGTPRILLIYVVCMIAGQAIAVGIGLLLDPYSKTLALSVFIPLYYAMYWVAWRVALLIGDTSPEAETDSAGGDGGSARESRELAARARGAGARFLRLGRRSAYDTARGGIRRGPAC